MFKKRKKFFFGKKSRDVAEQKQIAMERIEILSEMIRKNPQSPYTKRYTELMKRIKKLYRLR